MLQSLFRCVTIQPPVVPPEVCAAQLKVCQIHQLAPIVVQRSTLGVRCNIVRFTRLRVFSLYSVSFGHQTAHWQRGGQVTVSFEVCVHVKQCQLQVNSKFEGDFWCLARCCFHNKVLTISQATSMTCGPPTTKSRIHSTQSCLIYSLILRWS